MMMLTVTVEIVIEVVEKGRKASLYYRVPGINEEGEMI